MFDRFATWQYRDNGANCWDFVVEWIIENQQINLPKFDIDPKDKISMSRASKEVIRNSCIEIDTPVHGCIAAHYHVKTILHVGIVTNNHVMHTSSEKGTIRESIDSFIKKANKTRFYLVNGDIKNI